MSIRTNTGLVGAAIAALVMTGAPALAQEGLSGLVSPEQEAEIYCVYDILSQSGDTYAIADVFIDPDATWPLHSLGMRVLGEDMALDFGLAYERTLAKKTLGIGLPFASLTFNF